MTGPLGSPGENVTKLGTILPLSYQSLCSKSKCQNYPLDNFGTVVGENPDCLLLSGTVVGENPDHVCWVYNHDEVISYIMSNGQYRAISQFSEREIYSGAELTS